VSTNVASAAGDQDRHDAGPFEMRCSLAAFRAGASALVARTIKKPVCRRMVDHLTFNSLR
jgi:hypothetical protein